MLVIFIITYNYMQYEVIKYKHAWTERKQVL